MTPFEEDLFFLLVKYSEKAPIDLIKELEGMKYQVYINIDIFRNAKKYPPERENPTGKENNNLRM